MHPGNLIRLPIYSRTPDGSFTLPDYNLLLGPNDPIYETTVVNLLHLYFHAVIFIFYI